jgi:hypothetical protein
MAFISNTAGRWTGTQARDEKESVLDAVVTMAPQQTPLLAMLNRGENPGNIKYEWVVDNAGARPTAMSSVRLRAEGADASPTSTRSRTLVFNRTSIFGDSFGVTFTQQAVNLHGVSDEVGYQSVEYTKRLLVDFEFSILNGTLDIDSIAAPNTGSTGLVRKMGGLLDMVANPSTYVDTGSLGTTAQAYTAAASTDFAEDDILIAQQTCAERGGAPNPVKLALANGTVKRKVSQLFAPATGSSSITRRNMGSGDARTVVLPVDHIETDFGRLDLMWHQDMPAGQLLAIDPEYIEIMPLRDFQTYELGRVGSEDKYLIEGEFGLRSLAFNTKWRLTGVN